MKRLFKIALYVLGGLLAFLLLVAGATQTQFFRDRLREAAVSTLDSLLIADVDLGELTGNLISGFSLGPIAVRVGGDTLLAADRLDLQYDLFQIPGKTLAVNSVTLVRPRVTLVCGSDGVWNYQRMIRPAAADTAGAGPFAWSVVLRSFELREGSVSLTDSAALGSPGHEPAQPGHVEYHRFALTQVNLRSSLLYTAREQRVHVQSLSCSSEQAALNLDHLSGEFRITPRGTSVKGLEVATAGSRVKLDAELEGTDLLKGISIGGLRDARVHLRLGLHALELRELGAFLPPVDFLRGRVTLDLEARGTFAKLAVQRLDIAVGGSNLSLAGDLFNLHRPEDLFLRVHLTGAPVIMDDVRRLLPTMDLPELRSLGPVRLSLDFDGTPLDFQTRLTAESPAGPVQADVALTIGGAPALAYRGSIVMRGFDPSRLLDDSHLAGAINGRLKIEGSGVRLERLTGALEVSIDSSRLFGQPVAPSRISLEAASGDITGSVDIRIGAMRSALSARVTGLAGADASFDVNGEVTRLDLEDLFRRPAYSSDLTMRVRARGRGTTLDALSGEATLEIEDSRYADYRIESGSLHLLLDQRDRAHKELSLESNIADFELKGAFDLEYLTSLLSYEIRNIGLAVGEKFASVDSALASPVDRTALALQGTMLGGRATAVDATYLLRLKDLVPLSRVTGNRTFNGVGVLRGSLLGDYSNLSLEGRLSLQSFFYGSADSGILIQDADATIQVTDLKPTDPFQALEVYVLADAEKMHLNRTRFDSLQVSFKYSQGYSGYTAHARYDRDLIAGFNGIADVDTAGVLFTLNALTLAYRDFAWEGEGGASLEFGPRGIRVRDLVMRRDTQAVRFSGFLGSDGTLGASLHAGAFDLEGLQYLLVADQWSGDAGSFSGTAALDLEARGTMDQPEFTAALQVSRFAFRGVPFGAITGAFSYADGALNTDVAAQYRARTGHERPALLIKGVIPLDLGTGASDTPAPPLGLRIRSDGVQMSILDPLVPTFNQLSGIVRCDVQMEGSLQNPDISGEVAIDSCYFLFEPNNIAYTFEGRFKPSAGRIRVVEALVRNVAADRRLGRDGAMRITGDFALRELVPTDFDLTAVGSLLVVKETTRKSALSVYGNLFMETDGAGLHFTGSIRQSLLKGYVLVKNSSLIFPPTLAGSERETERTVPVVVFDDTSRAALKTDQSVDDEYFGSAPDSTDLTTTPGSKSVSFLDGLRYDLAIESRGGNTEIRMVFNPATGEELVANLDGKFAILEDGKRWVGSLNVERAYYNFTKRFNAEGTLRYSGDFLNPELDITATYAGVRTRRDSASGESRENIVVILKITGTRYAPHLEISMTIDGQDYQNYAGPKSADVGSDAIQFLLTGSFPLTESQKNDIAADIRTTVGSSLVTGATSLLSSTLSEFLRRETGFINSIEIGYGAQGTFGESADIRVSGVVGDGLWRIGGKVLEDPFNNANISLLYSLGDIFKSPSLRNFMFELERRVETSYGQLNDRKETNSARLFYRLSF